MATAFGAVAPGHEAAGATIEARLGTAHFAEPLVATGPTTVAEDLALLRAVAGWERRKSPDAFSSLTGFLAAHPKSAWRVAVLTNLGISYRHYGYLSRAVAAWDDAWNEGGQATDFRAGRIVDRAVGELVRLQARLGRQRQLAVLLNEISNRQVTGPATALVQTGRDTLWAMRHDPKHLYLCGPAALEALMLARQVSPKKIEFLEKVKAGPRGTNLAELAALAKEAHFSAEIVFRRPGDKVPVPSVVHWRVGHFAAIVGESNGRFHVVDPGFGPDGLWLTRAAIDAEASGYFLVPAGAAATAWRPVAFAEAGRVWGAGVVTGFDGNPFGGDGSDPDSGNSKNGCMCGWGIDEELVSLNLSDTPVGYTPPIGPAARVTIGYDQRDANQPANFSYFNVGPKWTLSWLSFVTDDPSSLGYNVTRYMRNGAVYSYSGYNSSTQAFAAQEDDASVLVLSSQSPVVYTRYLRDGTVEVYGKSDGSSQSPRNIFLTEVSDPQGNLLVLNYDTVNGEVRLVSLTDAAGRITKFTYGSPTSQLLVTRITDPFGRYARLTYNGSGQLASITDVLGLISRFSYDASGLVNQMTTPYGTTNFAYGDGSNGAGITRWLDIGDPLGYHEREEFVQDAPGVSGNEGTVPQGMSTYNIYLNYRDSFHWDRHQYAVAGCTSAPPGSSGCDTIAGYALARVTHFHHAPNGSNLCEWQAIEWDTVESLKEPLENRVWYNYPGQCAPYLPGAYDAPAKIGRVLANNSTQLTQLTYNAAGNPAQFVDPAGRQTALNYAANNIDVTSIQQTTASGTPTIARFTWNSQHRPLTWTDVAGQVWNYSYNAAGQLLSVADPLGETTSYSYDATGDLMSVVNADGKTAASFTYDGYEPGGELHRFRRLDRRFYL